MLEFPMNKFPKLSQAELMMGLRNWEDLDGAAYLLGRSMGMFDPDASFQTDLKWVFWSANPTGDFLYHMICGLVAMGIWEQDEEGDKVRWHHD
jgi:hypothetical protein